MSNNDHFVNEVLKNKNDRLFIVILSCGDNRETLDCQGFQRFTSSFYKRYVLAPMKRFA